jgi:hypothetical protein
MPSPNKEKRKGSADNKQLLLQYAGMATQFLTAIGLAVWIGLKADYWFSLSIPVLVWLLPLIVIAGMIIKAVRDTSKK